MRQKFGRHIKSFIPALCDRMVTLAFRRWLLPPQSRAGLPMLP